MFQRPLAHSPHPPLDTQLVHKYTNQFYAAYLKNPTPVLCPSLNSVCSLFVLLVLLFKFYHPAEASSIYYRLFNISK